VLLITVEIALRKFLPYGFPRKPTRALTIIHALSLPQCYGNFGGTKKPDMLHDWRSVGSTPVRAPGRLREAPGREIQVDLGLI